MKCVIIIDSNLDAGVKANISAALGITLSNHVSGLVGEDVIDANGNTYKGITNIPIPILSLEGKELNHKYIETKENYADEIQSFLFTDIAKEVHNYNEYIEKFKETSFDDIRILGMCLYGKRKAINKLTGNLKMLR